jgi:hypothetical protein
MDGSYNLQAPEKMSRTLTHSDLKKHTVDGPVAWWQLPKGGSLPAGVRTLSRTLALLKAEE